MFERYTEKARRSIFFARYEASNVGSHYMDTEHLLLGLFHEHGDPLSNLLRQKTTSDNLRAQIFDTIAIKKFIETSVDLPLTNECKRVLAYANEEALRLSHAHIGTEHLMLGLLREQGCLAEKLLTGYGFSLDRARAMLRLPDTPGIQGAASGVGVGTGSVRTRPSGRLPLVALVDAVTTQIVSTLASLPFVPRIGDSIVIRDAKPRSFRVQDVGWNFDHNEDAATLAEIAIQVLEEDAPVE